MAKFGLSFGNFEPIPEGKDVILRVKSVDDSKLNDFGKVKITLEDSKGRTHIENFTMYLSDGKTENSAGRWYLTNLYLAAMGISEMEDGDEVELQDMVDHYIMCDVSHERVESNKKPGSFNTFSRLGKEKKHAEGFEGEVKPKAKSSLNLDDILG